MVPETQILDVVMVLTVLHIRGGGGQHVTQVAQRWVVRLMGTAAGGAYIIRHVAAARRLVAVRCGEITMSFFQ